MTVKYIIARFERRGYKVARTWTGNIIITQPNGFYNIFESYAAAYRRYFG